MNFTLERGWDLRHCTSVQLFPIFPPLPAFLQKCVYFQIGGGQPGDGENVNLNATVSELSRKVESIEQQNAMTDVRIADHDIKMTMLETISYDGVFIWKIDDFGRRHQDAVSGRCLSSYSPQFYVGRYGYKVMICIPAMYFTYRTKPRSKNSFQLTPPI